MTPIPLEWIEEIFTALLARYGRNFLDRWDGLVDQEQVKQQWGADLSELSYDELRKGLDACRRVRFAPNCAEFFMLCRPPLNYEALFHEARKQLVKRFHSITKDGMGTDEWSFPALFWAAIELREVIDKAPYEKLKERWRQTLDDHLTKDYKPVKPYHAPARQIASSTVTPPAEGSRRIKELMRKLDGIGSKPEMTEQQREAERQRQLKLLGQHNVNP